MYSLGKLGPALYREKNRQMIRHSLFRTDLPCMLRGKFWVIETGTKRAVGSHPDLVLEINL